MIPNEAGAAPAALRARIAADLAPVRPLPPPGYRAVWLVPVALLLVVAAPAVFEFRPGAAPLGWMGTWGLSLVQSAVALAVMGAGLRDAVPGRSWSPTAAGFLVAAPLGLVAAITFGSWAAAPIAPAASWWAIGGLCLSGSAASAMPAVALGSLLAARAYPVHPIRTGALLGLGGGLMADAGWRLFCHFSEPAHVFSAHLAAIAVAVIGGMVLTSRLSGQRHFRS